MTGQMLPRDFDRLVRECFGPVLAPHGFTAEQTTRSTFWRRTDREIYHFIVADRFHHRPVFDVMVFASSPLIDRNFEAGFPDGLGVPSDTLCRLNAKSGIGSRGSEFPCATAKSFRAGFDAAVSPALIRFALPYLDGIRTIDDLVRTIVHPAFKYEDGAA